MAVHSSPDRPRSVLFVAPQPFFVNRGTPLNVRAFVCRLAEMGVDVHLLTFPYGEHVELPGVTIHRCFRLPGVKQIPIGFSWSKLAYDLLLLVYGFVLGLRYRISVFHGVEEGGVLAGCLGMVLRRPYVVDMDSCIPEQLAQSCLARVPWLLRLLEGIENFFLRHASAIVTVCESLTNRARSVARGVPIFQIEDFPIDSGTAVDDSHAERIRAELNVGDRQVVVYTGNLEAYQGIDLLLEAFHHLVRNIEVDAPPPLLVLVGGDGERLQWYRAQVARLQLDGVVHCLGSRPIEEMGTYMSLADVLASPRMTGENTPLKLYTYMISGKAIAATNIRSHTQALDETTAYLAEPTAESFAGALRAALDRTPEAVESRMRQIARALHLVETRFSKGAFDRRVSELYAFLFGTGDLARTTAESNEPSLIASTANTVSLRSE